jgi:hypothetical protein
MAISWDKSDAKGKDVPLAYKFSPAQVQFMGKKDVDFSGTPAQWHELIVQAPAIHDALSDKRRERHKKRASRKDLLRTLVLLLFTPLGISLLVGFRAHSAWLWWPFILLLLFNIWAIYDINKTDSMEFPQPNYFFSISEANLSILLLFFQTLERDLAAEKHVKIHLIDLRYIFMPSFPNDKIVGKQYPYSVHTNKEQTWFEGKFTLKTGVQISFSISDELLMHHTEYEPEIRIRNVPAHYKSKWKYERIERKIYKPARQARKVKLRRTVKYRYIRAVTITVVAPTKRFRRVQRDITKERIRIQELDSNLVVRTKFRQRSNRSTLPFDLLHFLTQVKRSCQHFRPIPKAFANANTAPKLLISNLFPTVNEIQETILTEWRLTLSVYSNWLPFSIIHHEIKGIVVAIASLKPEESGREVAIPHRQLSREQRLFIARRWVDETATLSHWLSRTIHAESLYERLSSQQKQNVQQHASYLKHRTWLMWAIVILSLLGWAAQSSWILLPWLALAVAIVWWTHKIERIAKSSPLPRWPQNRQHIRILIPFFKRLSPELDPNCLIRIRLIAQRNQSAKQNQDLQTFPQKYPRMTRSERNVRWFEGTFTLKSGVQVSFKVIDKRISRRTEWKPEIRTVTAPAHFNEQGFDKRRTRLKFHPTATTQQLITPQKTRYRYHRTTTAIIKATTKQVILLRPVKPIPSITVHKNGENIMLKLKFQESATSAKLDFNVQQFLSQLRSGYDRLVPRSS